MLSEPQTEVTKLIESAAAGDALATDKLFPLVYAELRRLAGGIMRGQGPSTLQPTALVNEAYLKLVGGGERGWDTRAHFFGAAARAMRQILIDHARRVRTARNAREHLKEAALPTLDSAADSERAAEDLLAVDAAMERLMARDQRQHQVVMLRFFAGLTIEETSLSMGLSTGTVKNEWNYARAWLTREVSMSRAQAGEA
jgi:RNA polymerase sigma factor (TIGR02999 family)